MSAVLGPFEADSAAFKAKQPRLPIPGAKNIMVSIFNDAAAEPQMSSGQHFCSLAEATSWWLYMHAEPAMAAHDLHLPTCLARWLLVHGNSSCNSPSARWLPKVVSASKLGTEQQLCSSLGGHNYIRYRYVGLHSRLTISYAVFYRSPVPCLMSTMCPIWVTSLDVCSARTAMHGIVGAVATMLSSCAGQMSTEQLLRPRCAGGKFLLYLHIRAVKGMLGHLSICLCQTDGQMPSVMQSRLPNFALWPAPS